MWLRDWSVGKSRWCGRLTGTWRTRCSCNLGTPCCGDLDRARPSKGIGSTVQFGQRILRRTVCGMCRSALLHRTTRVRLWWPDSRWARVACEGRLSKWSLWNNWKLWKTQEMKVCETTGDCFFFMLLRNPRNLSDGLSLTWVGGKEVRRDRRLHLLKSALERCEPLAGALWQWHSLGRSLV